MTVPFIIFGTRGVTSKKDRGQFQCPQCGSGCEYVHKSVRRFFTLYFIPVIPLDHLGEIAEVLELTKAHYRGILAELQAA